MLLEKNQSLEALTYARRSGSRPPGANRKRLTAMQRALAKQPALRTDPTRLEKANLLRGRALQFARQVLQKAISSPQAAGSNP